MNLSPLLNSKPCRKGIPKYLAWLVMAFGLFVLILGTLVKDDMPANAQTPNENALVQQMPAENEAPAVENGAQMVENEAPAAPNEVQMAENGSQMAENEAPAVENGSQMAQNEAPEAENSAQAAPMAASAEIPVAAAVPVNAPEQDLDAKYGMKNENKLRGNQVIIEQKKAEDTTSVLSRIMSIVGIFGFIGIAWLFINI